MIYLIAPTTEHAHADARDLCLIKHEYRVIIHPDQLRGINYDNVFLMVGGWDRYTYHNRVYEEFRMLLDMFRERRNSQHKTYVAGTWVSDWTKEKSKNKEDKPTGRRAIMV